MCETWTKYKYRMIRKSLMTHFIKSVHLNGGKDGCMASPADGARTSTRRESLSTGVLIHVSPY